MACPVSHHWEPCAHICQCWIKNKELYFLAFFSKLNVFKFKAITWVASVNVITLESCSFICGPTPDKWMIDLSVFLKTAKKCNRDYSPILQWSWAAIYTHRHIYSIHLPVPKTQAFSTSNTFCLSLSASTPHIWPG